MHAKRALGDAVFELVEKGDAPLRGVDVDLHAFVADFGVVGELGGEGVVVGCEEADAADVGGDVVEDCLGNCYAVVGACSAA